MWKTHPPWEAIRKRAAKGTNRRSAARGTVKMARAKAKRVGPLRKWWHSKREHHFQVYTLTTIFFSGLILYCFIFLFFMDGVQSLQNDGKDNLIPFVWLGLLGGSVALFVVAPEFHYFFVRKQMLEDILDLDSRPEVLRRRKEAEQAADLLGLRYQARLKGLYEMLGIKAGKKYSMDALPPRSLPGDKAETSPDEEE